MDKDIILCNLTFISDKKKQVVINDVVFSHHKVPQRFIPSDAPFNPCKRFGFKEPMTLINIQVIKIIGQKNEV